MGGIIAGIYIDIVIAPDVQLRKTLTDIIKNISNTIRKLEQENKELKDKLNTIMEQLEQLNNISNDTEPQQEQQTQPEPAPINKDNKEVDKKNQHKI